LVQASRISIEPRKLLANTKASHRNTHLDTLYL